MAKRFLAPLGQRGLARQIFAALLPPATAAARRSRGPPLSTAYSYSLPTDVQARIDSLQMIAEDIAAKV